MSFEGHLIFGKDDEERTHLRLHPIVNPTLGHLLMLPLGSEGALIDFNAGDGGRAVQAFVVTNDFIEHQRKMSEVYDADTSLGVSIMLYVLPDGHEGPLP